MSDNNKEGIKNNLPRDLSLIGKLFDLKYFYVLLIFILSADSYLIFRFKESILSIDFASIINLRNIKYLIEYIIALSFMVALGIRFIKFVLYKGLFKIIGRWTLNRIDKQKENSFDYIRVALLYREALLEQNQYKLDRANEYYKTKKEIDEVANIVMSVIIFIIIDLLMGTNDVKSLCSQVKEQLFIGDCNIIKFVILCGIFLFLYSSILALKLGYDEMWNDLIMYPKNK
jgi:hypothetical protein